MFEPKIQILTPEEQQEKRRQAGLLGVKLNRKFHCPEKVAAGFKIFAHGREKFVRIGVEDDGRHFVQVVSIDQEVKTRLAGLSSGKAFHEFLSDCYNQVLEIYELRVAAAKSAVQADQDFGKYREELLEKIEKDLREKRADQGLMQSQKIPKPQPAFNQGDFKTWAGLSHEDAQDSKGRLTEKKTGLLKKEDELEKRIMQFTAESEAFQKKVDALKSKLEAASDEKEYKDIRLTFDYNQLQVEKLKKKIEKNNEEKAAAQAELNELEKKIDILTCVLDAHQLERDAENWENRKVRTLERIRKTLEDRTGLYNTLANINKRWNDLAATKPEKRQSVYGSSKPIKEEEICKPLTLKGSATNYFL